MRGIVKQRIAQESHLAKVRQELRDLAAVKNAGTRCTAARSQQPNSNADKRTEQEIRDIARRWQLWNARLRRVLALARRELAQERLARLTQRRGLQVVARTCVRAF